MNQRRKVEIKSFFVGLGIFALMVLSSAGTSFTLNPVVNNDVIVYEDGVGIPKETARKADIQFQTLDVDGRTLSAETQVTSSEFDESYPAFDIDGSGNPFLLYQSYEEMGSSKLYMQRSADGGETWPADLNLGYWPFEDLIPIHPDIDFTDGVRAFGTNEFEGQEPSIYYHDYLNINDPASYATYYFDQSGYSTYISETDIAANKSGAVAIAMILDYQSDVYYEDTVLILWNPDNFADGTASGVFWRNTDANGGSIPRSHLCGDAGDKFFFCYESTELGKTTRINTAYVRIDAGTLYSDWKTGVVAGGSLYNCTHPDIAVSNERAYCVYMSDINGSQDIYVAVTTTGSMWKRYVVADSAEEEMYPTISANGESATCLFMKSGNLYKTSSDDAGVTWSTPVQVNSVDNKVVMNWQNVDCRGNLGIWTDNRNGNEDLYCDVVASAPFLTIDAITGGFGVKASLSNIGTAPAEDEFWSIDITGKVLVGGHAEGSVSLDISESKTVSSGFVLAFGPISITATVGDATKIASGLALGPFILGVS